MTFLSVCRATHLSVRDQADGQDDQGRGYQQRPGPGQHGARRTAALLAQSGGFFVHLGLGKEGSSSPGTVLTRAGALLIAAALIILAIGLIRHG